MDIFSEIGKRISQTTQSAVKGTKDLADIASINSQISYEQKLLNSFFMQIGKKYYELYHDSAGENFSSLCTSITECMVKITNFRDDIQKIKGIKKCPGCGAEVSLEATFCGTCGYDTRKEPESTEQFSKCPNCNKEITGDVAFCTECGQKLGGK